MKRVIVDPKHTALMIAGVYYEPEKLRQSTE